MTIRNARDEFIAHAMPSDMPRIKCALLSDCDDWVRDDKGFYDEVAGKTYPLPVNYTKEQLADFLGLLNFEYDAGYGGQELYGTIWYENGTYSQRGEYDGSEWWEHCKCPEIPAELRDIK